MRQLEQIHARSLFPRFGRPIIIRQLEEIIQLARNHTRDPFSRAPRRLRERRARRKADDPASLSGSEGSKRLLKLRACRFEVLEVGDDLCNLGKGGGGGELGADGDGDVVDEEPVEGLAEELVDVAVVLGYAVHE